MKTVAVLALLLLISVCFADVQISKEVAQDPVKCTKNEDCYDMTGDHLQYCNLQGVCATPTQQPFGTVILNSGSNSCSGSLLDLLTCVRIAGVGCTTPADNKEKTNTLCAAGAGSWNGTTCNIPNSGSGTVITYRKEKETCGSKLEEQCGFNLKCIRGVCRKLPSAGEPCFQNQCAYPLTCNLGYCTSKYSLPALSACTFDDVCASGDCTSNFCRYANRNQGCYVNGDCAAGECDNRVTSQTSKGQGKCFYPLKVAQQQYASCISSAVASTYYPESTGVGNKCDQQEVKLRCAEQCPKRPDLRFIRGDANIYNCLLLTKTPLKSDQCAISEQFQKCEAYQVYENAATGFSAPAKMIAMLALSAIALVFLL